jgi:drug/metabolite transporter (DMT)-like permease
MSARHLRGARSDSSPLWHVLLVSSAIIWGASFFILKDALDALPVSYLLAVRFLISGMLLSLCFIGHLVRHHDRAHVWRGCVMGLFLFVAYWLQTVGLTDTTPGKNAFLTAGYCVIVPFLYWIVARDRPDICNILAALLLVVGVGLVSLSGDLSLHFGDVMTISCAFFYAAHIVCTARFSKEHDVFVLTVFQFLTVGVVSAVVSLLTETPPPSTAWTAPVIGAMFYLIVPATIIALLFQSVGIKHVHPSTASILLSLESVFGVLFSVLFAGEQLTVKLTAGFALIFCAVLVSETKPAFLLRLGRGGRERERKAEGPGLTAEFDGEDWSDLAPDPPRPSDAPEER